MFQDGDHFWAWGSWYPKNKKNFFSNIRYFLKALAPYFTVFIYLETWSGGKPGIFTHFSFTNLPWCSQSMNSLFIYTLSRSPADHRRDHTSYYPLTGLCLWPWDFHQQGQGFYSREVREFVRETGKVRFVIFWKKVREK